MKKGMVRHYLVKRACGNKLIRLCGQGNGRHGTQDPVLVTCLKCLRLLHREALAHVDEQWEEYVIINNQPIEPD